MGGDSPPTNQLNSPTNHKCYPTNLELLNLSCLSMCSSPFSVYDSRLPAWHENVLPA